MGKIIMKILKEPDGVVSPGKPGPLRPAFSNRIRLVMPPPIAPSETPAMLPNLRVSSDPEGILSERAARPQGMRQAKDCVTDHAVTGCRHQPPVVDRSRFGNHQCNMYLTMFCYKLSFATAVRDMASNLHRKWKSLIDESQPRASPQKKVVPVIEGACLFVTNIDWRLINLMYSLCYFDLLTRLDLDNFVIIVPSICTAYRQIKETEAS